MESKNLIGMILAVTVGIICIGSVMVPVLTDATTTHTTFDNSEYSFYEMKELEVGDKWVHEGTSWTYDDVEITTGSNDSVSMVVTNDLVIRQSGQIRGATYGSNVTASAEISVADTLLINNSNSVSFTSGYGATNEGTYILKTYTDSAYVKGDTNLWATGVTSIPGTTSAGNVICHVEGTINDGVTVTVSPISGGATSNIVVGDATINYSPVSGYDNLYLIDNVVFGITADYTVDEVTTEKSTTATYSTFVIPKEVTAEKSVHFGSAENGLILIIPVMMIIAVMMVAVRFLNTRD